MSWFTVCVAALFIGVSHAKIPTFEYVSACDDIQRVFADGVLVGNETDWRKDIKVLMPTMTKVIAVSCRNKGGPAGILGSTPNGRVYTNATWKCSSQYEDKWNLPEFDDSLWPNASIVDDNIAPHHWDWKAHPNISSKAVWISSQPTDVAENVTIYCRLKLVYRFQMICDDYSTLYADGVEIGTQNGWKAVSNLMEIPKMATVFAISCANGGSFSGLMGSSFPTGRLITDERWKMYRVKNAVGKKNSMDAVPPENWMMPEYDDSGWQHAVKILDNKSPRAVNWLPQVHEEIKSNAWWIGVVTESELLAMPEKERKQDRSTLLFRRRLDCLWTNDCQL